MNFRTTSILFGALLGMLLVFAIVVQQKGPPEEGWLFPDIHDNLQLQVEKVVLERDGGKKYEFTKRTTAGFWNRRTARKSGASTTAG